MLDLSTVLAGPGCARYLADFGADVIKVERKGVGDTSRNLGWRDPDDDQTFFFKGANRNKRFVELDLRDPVDLERLLQLVGHADVLIENMRPGKLDALGLSTEVLHERNPTLVITRITAFGQTGPYKDRPGFASLAEAMSGYAALNGEVDGAPVLPPIALTDEATALAGAFATMVAVHSGVGQEVDLSLIESLNQLMGPLASLFLRTGEQQPRLGSGLPYSIPRGAYRTSDDKWVVVSTSADSVAARVMELIGLGGDARFETVADRMLHRDAVEAAMADWVRQRTREEAIAAFEAADAAAAPVYDIAELIGDPHAVDRRMFPIVDGYPMTGLVARLSETPGELKWPGRPVAADQDEVFTEFGLDDPPAIDPGTSTVESPE